MKSFSKFVAQALISGALLWWLSTTIDIDTLLQHLVAMSWSAMAALIVVVTFCLGTCQGYRWSQIHGFLGQKIPTIAAIQITLLATFFNQIIPAFIGGDISRVWMARRFENSLEALIIGVVLDRIIGMIGLVLLCLIGLPFIFDLAGSGRAFTSGATLVAAGVAGVVVIFVLRFTPARFTRWSIAKFAISLSEGMWKISKNPAFVAKVIAVSLVSQLAQVGAIFVIAVSIGVEMSVWQAVLLVPPILFVSMMPISIAGWGVREGAMAFGLGLISIPTEQAFAVSILFGGMAVGVGVFGGALSRIGGTRRTTNAADA